MTVEVKEVRNGGREIVTELPDGQQMFLSCGTASTIAAVGGKMTLTRQVEATVTEIDAAASQLHVELVRNAE